MRLTCPAALHAAAAITALAGLHAGPAPATLARIDTVFGAIDIDLFEAEAPATVANFLGYATSDRYDDSFFHRLAISPDGNPFVLQGGGFAWPDPNGGVVAIASDPPVVNEFGRSNTRGTIAMAKLGGDPDSATNQWFFNLGDNSANLDNQNGGFTVFAEVLGDGLQIVDQIAALERVNAGGVFNELPVRDLGPGNIQRENVVLVNSVDLLPEAFVFDSGFNATIRPLARDTVRVVAGRLGLDGLAGAVRQNGGTLAADAAGPLTLDGSLDQAGGALELRVDGGGTGTLAVTGDALLGGGLVLAAGDGSALDPYDPQVLVDAFFVGGRFAAVDASAVLPDGFGLALAYGLDQVTATAALRGDANTDGVVSLADFAALGRNFGASGRLWAGADFTGDGAVNLADFAALGRSFGGRFVAEPAAAQPAVSAVPEPAAAAVLLLAAPLLTRRR